MKDYDTAFNSAMYSVTKDREKRANRRLSSKLKNKYRFKHAKDSYCGYYIVDKKLVPKRVEITVKERPNFGDETYVYFYDYATGNYSRKLVNDEYKYLDKDKEIVKTVTRYTWEKIEKPYLKNFYLSGPRKLAKKSTDRKVRHIGTKDILGNNPSSYRKLFDYYWTIF